jgi:hypothetical protein
MCRLSLNPPSPHARSKPRSGMCDVVSSDGLRKKLSSEIHSLLRQVCVWVCVEKMAVTAGVDKSSVPDRFCD